MEWNYGDIYDGVAQTLPPDEPALIHVDPDPIGTAPRSVCVSWRELRAQSNRLARAFIDAGLKCTDKVAHYLRNEPAYLTAFVACCKARLTHVNVNYRYKSAELLYLLDNADCSAVVYSAEFSDSIAALQRELPRVKLWLEVGSGPVRNPFAQSFANSIAAGDGTDLGIARLPDDVHFVYTGGTTGMPKGVMWRHKDLWRALGGGGSNALKIPPAASLPEHLSNVASNPRRPRQMPCNPLMHGAGLMTAITALAQGGCVVTMSGSRFNAAAVLDAIARHRVMNLSIVGDAFGRPLLEELDRNPGRYDLSSLHLIVSTGAMWSAAVKEGLLRHNARLFLFDALGSSESVGFGTAATAGSTPAATAVFKLGADCKVFDENLREVPAGSGQPGFLARAGAIPLGYYKDPARTAKTFPTIDGVRYAIPGDYCLLAADGTITLLGRASSVINTGGEKVFAEEVEEALKQHSSVQDALVLGWPSLRFGQTVIAVVQLRSPAEEEALRDCVRARLADYKTPRRVLTMAQLPRAANGKPDYALAREHAAAILPGDL